MTVGPAPIRAVGTAPSRSVRRRAQLTLAGFAVFALGAAVFAQGAFIPAKAAVGQVLLDRAFDRSIEDGAPARPWPWADTWPVARVDAPRLDQSAIVLAGASGEAMAWGPAHMSSTPAPGDPGVSIIAAHRDTHFAFLKHLRAGDPVAVTRADGVTTDFVVTGTEIVRWDASGVEPHVGGPRLALVTCYPFEAVTEGPLRYIVWAEPV